MFDPIISIYASMVISNLTKGINDEVYKCGPLYITVDSNQFIILNWDFTFCSPKKHPDTIKFYHLNERNKIKGGMISIEGKLRSYYTTEHQFPTPFEKFPMGWNIEDKHQKFGTHCLPYVIESSRMGKVVDRRCLRIYPAWMQNFGALRLGEMMIPGTHNSGAWTGVPPILLDRYVLNQDRNLYEQLVFGQRYFDIRVGIYGKNFVLFSRGPPRFQITHSIIKTSNLEEELDNIARFVRKSPREIIILDIHKFNVPAVFTKKEHLQVVDLMDRKIGKYMIPKSAMGQHPHGPKLRRLWAGSKSIIVAYKEPDLVEKHPFFWPAIKRDWGNKVYLNGLKDYIISVARSNLLGNPMRVLMAELTPTFGFILLNPIKGLGRMADEVNRNLTLWIRDNQLAANINLIATDFFLGNRMTEFAIGVNRMKLCTRIGNCD